VLRELVYTSLNGTFHSDIVQKLSELVVEWIMKCIEYSVSISVPMTSQELYKYIAAVLAQEKVQLIQAPFGSVDQSKISLPSEYMFLKRIINPSAISTSGNTRFILILGSFDAQSSSINDVTYEISTAHEYIASINWPREVMKKFICDLRVKHHVNLVLCTESIPENVSAGY